VTENKDLWAELKAKKRARDIAQEGFEAAREALVSRLCSCYRVDEKWEDRAMYCPERMSNTCPYFLELRSQNL
jgi:hypothetical protein